MSQENNLPDSDTESVNQIMFINHWLWLQRECESVNVKKSFVFKIFSLGKIFFIKDNDCLPIDYIMYALKLLCLGL